MSGAHEPPAPRTGSPFLPALQLPHAPTPPPYSPALNMLGGVSLKWMSLVVLVVQNSALVIVLKFARSQPGPKFLSSTAVVLSELFKLLVSAIVYLRDERQTYENLHHRPPTLSHSLHRLWADVFGPDSHWVKLTVPAVLYFVQNNLQYVAAGSLDAATFQVTYQMKILTTALFSVFLLNRTLSFQKWLSLVLLTLGIALVQLPVDALSGTPSTPAASTNQDPLKGFLAVAGACVLSGLAGVYFEKILKGTSASLWVRNVQLSLFTVVPGYAVGVLMADGRRLVEGGGFFQGYTAWTWCAVGTQAFGGLVVALVVKYADNILKGFATSVSIILSTLASMALFDTVLTWAFLAGASLVIYATVLYGQPDKAVGNGRKEEKR